MTISEIQDQIIEEFGMFEEWMDKYEYLIELGKTLPLISSEHKTPEHLIEGCQSRVWLHASADENAIVTFTADSDAIITKGIVGLLIRVLSGKKATEIINAELYFIEAIGLSENLSPTRSNGLLSMIKQMKMYAVAFNSLKSCK